MAIEGKEQFKEIKRLGNIEIEETLDGRITRINEISLQPGDKIIIIQRHQKPGSFSKEQLLKNAPEDIEALSNLDYTYNPEITEEGTKAEEHLLAECQKVFRKVDLIATTPRKRGSEHKKLLQSQFPDAEKNSSIDRLLDDSGLGLLGESFYGAYKYTPEEAKKLFKPTITKEIKFGRGTYQGERLPFSYMETWVKLGYIDPKNKWKVENPEELATRTATLLETIDKETSYFITHEANCVTFHLLAQRTPEMLSELLNQIEIPDETRNDIEPKLKNASNILELYKLIKQSLNEHPVKGFNYEKALIFLLENVQLKSGNKGYGAISIYVLRENEENAKTLIEPAYDIQVEENPKLN